MSESTCTNAAQHTPQPDGIVAWQSWAAAMWAQGSRQSRCSFCGLYKIWGGLKPPIPPHEHERTVVCIAQPPTGTAEAERAGRRSASIDEDNGPRCHAD